MSNDATRPAEGTDSDAIEEEPLSEAQAEAPEASPEETAAERHARLLEVFYRQIGAFMTAHEVSIDQGRLLLSQAMAHYHVVTARTVNDALCGHGIQAVETSTLLCHILKREPERLGVMRSDFIPAGETRQ